MFNRIIIIKIMKIIMKIVIINFFINRNRIKIKDSRKYRFLKFFKRRILTIFSTRIMILKIITKILFIKIFIYIMKMRNNFIMRIKKNLLKKKKRDFENNKINVKFIFVIYYVIIKKKKKI